MGGGPSREKRFAERSARSLEISAVSLTLEDDFNGESIHGVHKS